MANVTLDIPDDLVNKLSSAANEVGGNLRLAAAFSLCSRGRLSTSQAARLAGLTYADFLEAAARRRWSCIRSTSRNSRRRSVMVSLWVVNASPIILLTKIGLVDLLKQLGPPIVIPAAAVLEIQRRGPSDAAVQALAQSPWLATVDPGAVGPLWLRTTSALVRVPCSPTRWPIPAVA